MNKRASFCVGIVLLSFGLGVLTILATAPHEHLTSINHLPAYVALFWSAICFIYSYTPRSGVVVNVLRVDHDTFAPNTYLKVPDWIVVYRDRIGRQGSVFVGKESIDQTPVGSRINSRDWVYS